MQSPLDALRRAFKLAEEGLVYLYDLAAPAHWGKTAIEVILMKDGSGRVIGFELLHYRPAASTGTGLTVETVIQTQP